MRNLSIRLVVALALVHGTALAETVSWHSEEGISRLEQSRHKVDFFLLANQFENQTNKAFCGPTSLAIVMNAIYLQDSSHKKPKDEALVEDAARKHLKDPIIERYTPNTVFNGNAKTRFQVFGEPMDVNGETKSDYGLQLKQLHKLVEANGLKSEVTVVDDQADADKIKATLIKNLSTADDYVIVNYQREVLGQGKGGHISPLGAYDQKSDSFLIMDVNSSRAPWVWVNSADLINAMKTFDTVENRGFIIIKR